MMVLLLFCVFYLVFSDIELTCYNELDCKGSSVAFHFTSGDCRSMFLVSSEISCTISGYYVWKAYTGSTCDESKLVSTSTVEGGGCENNGGISCKLSGCVNILAIVLGVLIPVVLICLYCCVVIGIGIIVIIILLVAGGGGRKKSFYNRLI